MDGTGIFSLTMYLLCGVNIVISVAQLSKFSIFIVHLYEYYII
jgi:hypothetical protein